MANKYKINIEEAAKYLKLGNPDDETEMFLDEAKGYQLIVLPLEKGYEWNCLEVEMLVAAQSLVNVYCNKQRLIDGSCWYSV